MVILRCAGFPYRIEHYAAGKQLGQNIGRFFVRAGDDYIGRNPATPDAAEFACDFGIVASPVGAKKDIVSTKKLLFNTVVVQNSLFVDLA